MTGVLRTDFAATERPVAFLEGAVPEARAGLGQIAALGKSAVAVGDTVTIGDVAVQAKLATELRVLALGAPPRLRRTEPRLYRPTCRVPG